MEPRPLAEFLDGQVGVLDVPAHRQVRAEVFPCRSGKRGEKIAFGLETAALICREIPFRPFGCPSPPTSPTKEQLTLFNPEEVGITLSE
jgi:hypothetical protein